MLGAGAHVRFCEGVGLDVFRLIEDNGYAAILISKKAREAINFALTLL